MSALVARRSPGRAAAAGAALRSADLAAFLVAATALAGAVEFVVLRVLTRTAIHVPGISTLGGPYAVVAGLGRFAFYLAAVLAVLTLAVLAGALARRRAVATVAAAVALLLFLAAAALARAGLFADVPLAIVSVGAVTIVAVAGLASPGTARRASLMLFAASFLLSAAFALAQPGMSGTYAPDGLAWLLPLGEVVALLWCLGTPLLLDRRGDRSSVAWGVGVALCTFVALRVIEATVKIIFLWDLGLAGYLPDAAYAIAFGAFAYAVATAVRLRRFDSAWGLILLALGGVGLHSTYQTALVLAGLIVLGPARNRIVTDSPRAPASGWPGRRLREGV